MVMQQKFDQAYWQHMTEAQLPPEHEVVLRNEAITGIYASWYTAQPLFKWAGMAAFASHRVGLALMPYRVHLANDLLGDPDATGDTRSPEIHTVLADLHGIRSTNNSVFHDIGWAHVAYMSPDGGIAAIESCLAAEPQSQLILEGFRAIEQGRLLLRQVPKERRAGIKLVWKGNTLLLSQHYTRFHLLKTLLIDQMMGMFI